MTRQSITKYIPHRCKYCRTIMSGEERRNLYCSIWCQEEEELSREKLGKCIECGKIAGKYYYKKDYICKSGKIKKVGQIAGNKKYCDECGIKHGQSVDEEL